MKAHYLKDPVNDSVAILVTMDPLEAKILHGLVHKECVLLRNQITKMRESNKSQNRDDIIKLVSDNYIVLDSLSNSLKSLT